MSADHPSAGVVVDLPPPPPPPPPQEQQVATEATTSGAQAAQLQQQQQQASNSQWVMSVASQTSQGVRQRVSLASDQLGQSLRQLYASASNISDVPPSYHNIPGIVPYYHGRSSGPPPAYDDVINPYAAPPTYQSLFGRMREARKTSRGLVELVKRLLIILASTLGCTLLLASMVLIPVAMIIIGSLHINDCRIDNIPSFLLFGGIVLTVKNITNCYAQCSYSELAGPASLARPELASGPLAGGPEQHQSERADCRGVGSVLERVKDFICSSMIDYVLACWFIEGCRLVLTNYEPDYDDPASPRYCNRTVYMYTFWLIGSMVSILGLFFGCVCCLMVSSAIASRQDDDSA